MPEVEPKKRSYKRLTEADGARARALWEAGAATLEEIAAEIGVSQRSLQLYFAKWGVVRGSAAHATAKGIIVTAITEEFGDVDSRIEKGRASRLHQYTLASKLEKSVSAILSEIAEKPTEAFRFSAPLKAIDLVTTIIERTGRMKLNALGLSLTSADYLDPRSSPTLFLSPLSDD